METNRSINKILNEDVGLKEMLPYERFMEKGPEALTDAELLAIIIRTGTSKRTPMEIGNYILNMCEKYGKGISGIRYLTMKDLMSVPGIGSVKAVKLMCIAEISNRMSRSRARNGLNFNVPDTVAGYYMEKMCNYRREHVIVACLNNQGRLICEFELSVGTVNSAPLSPREVFLYALKNNAVQIVLLHNHPGGDPKPSKADIKLTEELKEAGILLDIRLLDHIIIGDHKYYSFSKNNTYLI